MQHPACRDPRIRSPWPVQEWHRGWHRGGGGHGGGTSRLVRRGAPSATRRRAQRGDRAGVQIDETVRLGRRRSAGRLAAARRRRAALAARLVRVPVHHHGARRAPAVRQRALVDRQRPRRAVAAAIGAGVLVAPQAVVVDVPELGRVAQHAVDAAVLDEANEQVLDAPPQRCPDKRHTFLHRRPIRNHAVNHWAGVGKPASTRRAWVERAGRAVEHEDVRVGNERARDRDRDAVAEPAGKRSGGGTHEEERARGEGGVGARGRSGRAETPPAVSSTTRDAARSARGGGGAQQA